MRRLVVSIGVACGLVLIGAGPAFAEPLPEGSAPAAKATPGKQVCKITDERLDELSGIVATDDGFIVINDSAQTENRKRVFFLDRKCKVQDTVSYPGGGPRDTEDLVLSADGETLWIADIGDNQKERSTIGLWTMPADGSKRPVLHRLTYPDGAHDAEAMLLNGDGTPLIITKEVGRPAAVYQPTAKLEANNDDGVPMKKVAEITVPPSSTPGNTIARLGRGTIDGGAVASGGTKVALRTYTDALEWTVAGGDVVAAIQGQPRVTPLPNEPQGEAITYSPDGKVFYTVSDMQGETDNDDNYILEYAPAAKTELTAANAGAAGGDEGGSFFDGLTLNDITYLVGGVGVLGAILVGAGIFGIMRHRKNAPAAPVAKAKDGGKSTDPETELLAVGGAAAGAGVYGRAAGQGGNRPPAKGGPGAGGSGAGGPGAGGPGAGGPGVYGRGPQPTSGAGSGGVYGGGGRGPAGGQPGGGRAPAGGQPGGRPGPGGGRGGGPASGGRGGEYGGRPGGSGAPGGGGGGRPGPGGGGRGPAGQPGRPAPGGGGGRPSGAQPGRGGAGGGGGQPGRAPGGGQPGRGPGGGGGQPGRGPGGGGGQSGRSPSGGQQPGNGGGAPPGRGPGGGGAQPGRGAGGGGGQPGRGSGGGRPSGGQPGRGPQPGGGGVYGGPPQASSGQSRPNGQAPRPSGFFGQGGGHSDPRQPDSSHNRDYDAPGYR